MSRFLLAAGGKVWTRSRVFGLDKLEVFSENLVCKAVQIDCFSHGFVHPTCGLFHLFVLCNEVLLESGHLAPKAFDGAEFVVWLCLLNFVEDLEDIFVLVLHVHQSHLLPFVLSDELGQLLTLLDFIQTLNELVCKRLNPLNVFVLDSNESFSDVGLPLCDDVDVWSVLIYGPDCVLLDLLIVLKLLLVAFVDVV